MEATQKIRQISGSPRSPHPSVRCLTHPWRWRNLSAATPQPYSPCRPSNPERWRRIIHHWKAHTLYPALGPCPLMLPCSTMVDSRRNWRIREGTGGMVRLEKQHAAIWSRSRRIVSFGQRARQRWMKISGQQCRDADAYCLSALCFISKSDCFI